VLTPRPNFVSIVGCAVCTDNHSMVCGRSLRFGGLPHALLLLMLRCQVRTIAKLFPEILLRQLDDLGWVWDLGPFQLGSMHTDGGEVFAPCDRRILRPL